MIGKFIICAAKTKALDIARRGATDVEYVFFTFLQAHTRNPIEAAYISMQIVMLKNPSGMCIQTNQVLLF